jgi:hypothetical protein
MISTDGAALIAQVYPVGILLIGLESRALPKMYATTKAAFVCLVAVAILMGVAVWSGVQSTIICVRAVSGDAAIVGGDAVLVEVAGWLLSNIATLLLVIALGETFGLWNRIASSRKTLTSPRRTSAMLDRIERFHPGAGREN